MRVLKNIGRANETNEINGICTDNLIVLRCHRPEVPRKCPGSIPGSVPGGVPEVVGGLPEHFPGHFPGDSRDIAEELPVVGIAE